MSNMNQTNPECKKCGLLKSTVKAMANPRGRKCEHDFGHSPKSDQSGWEISFDEKFYSEGEWNNPNPDKIKSFIRQLLLSQSNALKEELKQKVKEIKPDYHYSVDQDTERGREIQMDYQYGFDRAKVAILQLLDKDNSK